MRKAILLTVVLFLFGCGKGGGVSPGGGSPATVSGVAATGSPVSGTVYLKDSNGVELSRATSNGTFAFDVSTLAPPFMLKAAWGGGTVYSFAVTAGTANITPLTQVVVAAASGGRDLDAMYATADRASFAAVAAQLPAATGRLQAALHPLLVKYSADVDPITGTLVADGTGMDAVLDQIKVSYAAGTVSLADRLSGATLFSAPLSALDRGVSALAWNDQLAGVASDPVVQVSPAGRGLAVWWQPTADNGGSTINALWLDGGASPVQLSAGAGYAYAPQLAFDASGDAIVVWMQYQDSTRTSLWAIRSAGGKWGTPALLMTTEAPSNASLGVDGAGNAIVAWAQLNRAVNSNHFDLYASRYAAATGSWSAPAMVSNGSNSAYGGKVAVNPSGVAVLIWVEAEDDGSTSNGPADIWGVTGSTTGSWGNATKLNSLAGSQYQVYGQAVVAIDAAGDALAGWVQTNSSGLFDIWVCRRAAGGGWGTPVTLSAGTTGECYGPDLAFDGQGNAVVVWEQQSDADSSQVTAASRYTAGSGWSTPVQLSPSSAFAFQQHVAVDASGNATVVWYQMEPTSVTVRSVQYLPLSGWGTPQLVATTKTDGYMVYPVPAVATNSSGQSFVVWGTDSY